MAHGHNFLVCPGSQMTTLFVFFLQDATDFCGYPLVICYSLLLKMAIEIVSFPMKNGDFP